MFKIHLSEALRQELALKHKELIRLYALASPWLGAELLKLARLARQSTPHWRPHDCVYDARLVWGIVPELARRLAPHIRLQTDEIDWETRALSNAELRKDIGYTLANIGHNPQLEGWKLLTTEAVNGNPVVFGIDRLQPGDVRDREDPLTRRLVEIAHTRGTTFAGVWTPQIMKDRATG